MVILESRKRTRKKKVIRNLAILKHMLHEVPDGRGVRTFIRVLTWYNFGPSYGLNLELYDTIYDVGYKLTFTPIII